jgi:hypothetical protein
LVFGGLDGRSNSEDAERDVLCDIWRRLSKRFENLGGCARHLVATDASLPPELRPKRWIIKN